MLFSWSNSYFIWLNIQTNVLGFNYSVDKKSDKMAGDEEKAEEEKDTELDLIAEQELLRLMRQFRVMTNSVFRVLSIEI